MCTHVIACVPILTLLLFRQIVTSSMLLSSRLRPKLPQRTGSGGSKDDLYRYKKHPARSCPDRAACARIRSLQSHTQPPQARQPSRHHRPRPGIHRLPPEPDGSDPETQSSRRERHCQRRASRRDSAHSAPTRQEGRQGEGRSSQNRKAGQTAR